MENRKKTKELSGDLRNQIVRKHEQSQGYKSISKDLNVPVSTVRNVIKKFKAHGTVANLPRCGRKRKIDKRFQRKIVQMLDKEPRLTSKQVQAALQSEGTTVSTCTIRRHLNEKRLYGNFFNKCYYLWFQDLNNHKKQGVTLLSKMGESVRYVTSGYKLRYRPLEFSAMTEYLDTFALKLGTIDRIAQRIIKEEVEYLVELREYGPVHSTWSALEGELQEPLEGVSACIGNCSTALEELTEDMTEDFLPVLREYILYSESMKVRPADCKLCCNVCMSQLKSELINALSSMNTS
ncbi:unnamed protein product [Ranitomeya imitator]|uniref:Transposase n=1 Tax=Ranitomeya imitator TaxID=111125 RepID=A0ABN9LJT4_9NEOB|nr:unnamed protein product [Ranitomeya imitator]